VWSLVPDLVFPPRAVEVHAKGLSASGKAEADARPHDRGGSFSSMRQMVKRCVNLQSLGLRGCQRQLRWRPPAPRDPDASDDSGSDQDDGMGGPMPPGLGGPMPGMPGMGGGFGMPMGDPFVDSGGDMDDFSSSESSSEESGDVDMSDTEFPGSGVRTRRRRRRKAIPRLTRLLELAPNLSELDISDTGVDVERIPVSQLCPRLRVFRAARCTFFIDGQNYFFNLLNTLPQLEVLDLRGCPGLYATAPIPGSLADNLTTLLLSDTRVSDGLWTGASIAFEIYFPRLRHLELAGTDISNTIVNDELPKLMDLEILDLGRCQNVSAVSLQLPYLQRLSLRSCQNVQDLTVDAERLEELEVANLATVRQMSLRVGMSAVRIHYAPLLEHVTLACPNLLRLDLLGCYRLTPHGISVLESPRWDTLELRRMDSIRESSLADLCASDANGEMFPSLRHVIIEDCKHLRGLTVPSNCRWETLRVVSCPVDSDGSELSSVSKSHVPPPTALRTLEISSCPHLKDSTVEYVLGLALPGRGPKNRGGEAVPLPVATGPILAQQLTELDLSFCPKVTENLVQEALVACRHLEVLRLRECQWVYSITLRAGQGKAAFVAAGSTLRVLDLESCGNLQSLVLESENANPIVLTTLNIDWCTKLGNLIVRAPDLREFSMKGCTNLETATVVSTSLSQLDVSNAIRFSRMEFQISSLTELNLTKLLALSDTVLHDDVLNHTPLLTRLSLMGCKMISRVDLSGLLHLRTLSLQEMRTLADILLPEGFACKLTSLELSMCRLISQEKLEAIVNEAAAQLRSVSVRLMPGITSPKFRSGSIDHVQFRQCQKLASVDLQCPRLYRAAFRGVPALRLAQLLCRSLKVIEVDPAVQRGKTRRSAVGMTDLRLSQLPHFTRSVALRLARVAPSLQRLDLLRCPDIQEAGLEMLAILYPERQLKVNGVALSEGAWRSVSSEMFSVTLE
jgi:Leucine-rich repeat (LRR) protein